MRRSLFALLLLFSLFYIFGQNGDVTAIEVLNNEHGILKKYSFPVPGTPYEAPLDYAHSPSSWGISYSPQHAISSFANADGSLTVFWKDMKSGKFYITGIGKGLNYSTIELSYALDNLGGMTRDEEGNFYYFTYGGPEGRIKLALIKLNKRGREVYKKFISTEESLLNIKALSTGTARIAYGEGVIAIMVAKGRHDGHQDGVMALFKAEDGSLIKNLGNICSHSFDHRLHYYRGSFISINLGDNYPRGIRIRRAGLDGSGGARLVYTFKTQHSTTAKGNLPVGKWSNDNRTYTEIGEVLPSESGYVVTFCSEKSVDNSKAKENLNEPRNLGMVLVTEQFNEQRQDQYIVNDEVVISKGSDSKEFGFYTYGGGWTKQRNVGVVWLTDYKDKKSENASRVHTLKVAGNRFLILWEKWSQHSFLESYYMLIDERGKRLSQPISLGALRLPRGYEPFLLKGSPAWLMGDRQAQNLTLYHFELNAGDSSSSSSSKTVEKDEPADYYIKKTDYRRAEGEELLVEGVVLPDHDLDVTEKFNLKVRVEPGSYLRGTLMQNGQSLPGLTFARKMSGETKDFYTFTIRPYQPGSYSFLLEASRDGLVWVNALTVPIEVGKEPADRWTYPEQPHPYGEKSYSLETPLTGVLKSGQTYLFKVTADNCEALYLKNHKGKIVELKREGTTFELIHRLPAGEGRLELIARFRDEAKGVTIFRYWVKRRVE